MCWICKYCNIYIYICTNEPYVYIYILHITYIYIYTRCLIYYTGTCSDGMCSEMSKLYIIVLFYVVYIYIFIWTNIYMVVSENGVYTKSIAN
jgi:hypothetical protein